MVRRQPSRIDGPGGDPVDVRKLEIRKVASDMAQEVTDSYGTSWLDDMLALGGGDTYGTRPAL